MKVAFILVAVFAVFASSSRIDERGIADNIQKFKDFLEYLKSQELKDKVKAIEDRIKGAPQKAEQCFMKSTEGSKGDREAALKALEDLLNNAFPQDNEDKNLFYKLLDLVQGLAKVIGDPSLGKNIKEIGAEYQDAFKQAIGCYKDELKGVKEDVESIISDIKSKFF